MLLFNNANGVTEHMYSAAEITGFEIANKTLLSGIVCMVVLDRGYRYRDVNGNHIINAYTRFLGMNLLKTTLYWILGGIGGLIFLIVIIVLMMSSDDSNSSNKYNNSY